MGCVVPVLMVGAKLSDYRQLGSVLNRGEILPAVYSTPDDVLSRVRRYVQPNGPPRDVSDVGEVGDAGATIVHDGRQWDPGEDLLG
jgi:hypothetical protein